MYIVHRALILSSTNTNLFQAWAIFNLKSCLHLFGFHQYEIHNLQENGAASTMYGYLFSKIRN